MARGPILGNKDSVSVQIPLVIKNGEKRSAGEKATAVTFLEKLLRAI